jgi:hypothetical protein
MRKLSKATETLHRDEKALRPSFINGVMKLKTDDLSKVELRPLMKPSFINGVMKLKTDDLSKVELRPLMKPFLNASTATLPSS